MTSTWICVASPNFMIAPLPKRRSICCKARSIAFSRSVETTGVAELLRSVVDLSFLLISIAYYRVKGIDRVVAIPLFTALHSSFLMVRNNKQVHSYLLHCFPGSLV